MGVLIMAVKTPTTLLGEPEEYTGATAQDSVTVHVLGFDQITRENFRVKLQAQAELTGGRDPEGLPLGVFLNGILIGKATFDEFGVAGAALTIEWDALKNGKALTVKVKGMEKAVLVQWDVPKSWDELYAEEWKRLEKLRLEKQEQQEKIREEWERQEKLRLEKQEKSDLEKQKRQEEERQRIIASISQNMVNISAGTFWMGATDNDQFKQAYELPRHQVKLAAFAISSYLVTQAQWQAVMRNNPSQFKGDDLPVENVSWNDCQIFLQKLNATVRATDRTSAQFRLPTEAEWEYACRAGTETIWPFGDDWPQLRNYAWFNDNSGNQTHLIGQIQPNIWGLYDMLGNVKEWCQDWFDVCYYADSPQENPQGASSGEFRVVRGGAWYFSSHKCRSAGRDFRNPNDKDFFTGFRVACSL